MRTKKLISMLTITLFLNVIALRAEDEPVLAEAVEMPGNVVGSLFGGGYAKREHDKKEMKNNKKSKKDQKDQPANRRQARRQRRRSSSSDE